ncbi:conserved Plasmodium protein, unknown function [Plasmodium sp. DRC-Itaito]|nr:conserved Plasmodium protein, unknown function [Plasmodium sp. DRC-Itaito]
MDVYFSEVKDCNSDQERDSIFLNYEKMKKKFDYKIGDNNDQFDNVGIPPGIDGKNKEVYDDIKRKDIYDDIKRKDIYDDIKKKDIYDDIKKKDIYDDIKKKDIYDDIKKKDIYDDIKKKDIYDDIKRKDIYDDIKGKDIYDNIKKKDIYDNIKKKDIYDDIKKKDIYDDIKRKYIYDDIKKKDIYDNIKNIHVSIYDGQKKDYVEERKYKMKFRDEENILYDKKVEKENYNDTIDREESNHNMNIDKEYIPSEESMKKSKILYKECISHEKDESKNVRTENDVVDKIVVKLGDETCTYEEDDYINNMTTKKKENIEEGIKLLSNLKDDVVIECMENKGDNEKIKISQCDYDKIRVRYNDCKYKRYVNDCDKYNNNDDNNDNNNDNNNDDNNDNNNDDNNNDNNYNYNNCNNMRSLVYDNGTDTCPASTFSGLINKDRIYHIENPDLYIQRNFVESQKKLEPKKETITFSFRDKCYEDLKDVDPRGSKFFHYDKDEYTNYMLINDGNIKDDGLKEEKEKSSVVYKGYDLYGNKCVDSLYNNKCIDKRRKDKMNYNKIKGISCDKNIYSIHNRIKKKEEDICVKDIMQNRKKTKEKNKIHIKLQNLFDMKTCKNNDMFTCPMKKEKQIDTYKNYGNIIYKWVLKNSSFNYPTSIKGKDKKVYNIDDVKKKSVQRIYKCKLSEKYKEEKKNGSLNNGTDIRNKKGILKNKPIIYKDNKTMNGFNLRNNLLNILDTSKLYPKCELMCRIKKS